MSSSFDIPFVVWLVAAVVLVVGAVWAVRRHNDPDVCLISGDRALVAGRADRAERFFSRAVSWLAARGKAATPEQQRKLAEALVRLGLVQLRTGRTAEAVECFVRAGEQDAALPAMAVCAIAEYRAQRGDTGADAIDAYILYLTQEETSRTQKADEQVLAVLQRAGTVSERQDAESRRLAVAINERIVNADPGIEWAHYFLGLAAVLAGNFAQALNPLTKARLLNPDRPTTYYWLIVSHLQQPSPDLDAAVELTETFVSFRLQKGKEMRQQAAVAHEIGRRFAESAGGLSIDAISQDAWPLLRRALRFLELAATRQPDQARYQSDYGQFAMLASEITRGLTALEAAVRLDPAVSEYQFRLARAYERLENHSAAIAMFRQVIASTPSDLRAHRHLARLALRTSDYETAEASSRQALDCQQPDAELCSTLIQALFGQAKYETVMLLAREFLGQGREGLIDSAAAIAAGRSFARGGEFGVAIEWYQRSPGSVESLYYTGCAHAHVGALEPALACFEPLASGAGEWSVKALQQIGHLLRRAGRLDEAHERYRAARDKAPLIGDISYALGALAVERGNLESASDWFAAAIAVEPLHTAARHAAATVAEAQGAVERAISLYESIAEDPVFAQTARLRLGVLNYRRDDFEAARHWLSPESSAPSDSWLFYRGATLLKLGRAQEALALWITLAGRHLDDDTLAHNVTMARYAVGALEYRAGHLEEAAIALEECLTAHPADDRLRHDVARLHFAAGAERLGVQKNDAEAATRLVRALALDPDNPLYRFYGAICALLQGDDEGSLDTLRRLRAAGDTAPQVLALHAFVLLQCGRQSEGRATLTSLLDESAIPSDDYTRWAASVLANDYVRERDYSRAAEILAGIHAYVGAA